MTLQDPGNPPPLHHARRLIATQSLFLDALWAERGLGASLDLGWTVLGKSD